jgi:hypothetical protein
VAGAGAGLSLALLAMSEPLPPRPILDGFTADPSIRVFGDTYYVYPTSDKHEWMTTDFSVWSSKDLVRWKKERMVLDVANELSWAKIKAWAPDCIERDGTYFFYFCAEGKIGVATGDNPAGPFKDALGRPLLDRAADPRMTTNPIDPYPFIDDDGQAYLYWGNGYERANALRLSRDMLRVEGDLIDIPIAGTSSGAVVDFREGVVVFKRGGRYYFMWSVDDARSDDYRVAYGVADSPLGPVRIPAEGALVLSKRGIVKGTGHHSVVRVPGTDRWYMAYHRHAIPVGGGYQRETCLARMEFAEDGRILPVDPWRPAFVEGDVGEPITAAVLAAEAKAKAGEAADGGFLFVTFKGEQTPRTEQVYFATSADGRAWTALNGAEPVLESALGERGVRDPFVLRAHDGRGFFLIATDLSINLNPDWSRAVRAGSRAILVWRSEDLVNWSGPRRVEVAPEDAGCAWAPEAIYDEEAGEYLVFWASTTGRDDFAKHRIWAARTKDFATFGAPFLYIEKETTVIDTTIVREGGRYHRFSKDEKHKAITLETAERLGGPWREVPEFSLAKLVGYEGPQCYRVPASADGRGAAWCLILDHYAAGEGYKPFVATELAGGRFEPGAGFAFPFKFRHGSVLPITAAERARLEAAFARGNGR